MRIRGKYCNLCVFSYTLRVYIGGASFRALQYRDSKMLAKAIQQCHIYIYSYRSILTGGLIYSMHPPPSVIPKLSNIQRTTRNRD